MEFVFLVSFISMLVSLDGEIGCHCIERPGIAGLNCFTCTRLRIEDELVHVLMVLTLAHALCGGE